MTYNLNYYSDEDPLATDELAGGSQLYKEAQLSRVKFASRYINKETIVGDVCSGPPFASKILNCRKYYGVDHPDLIQSLDLKQNYPKNLEMVPYAFENKEAVIEFPEKMDVILSFETLEHTPKPVEFLQHIANGLKTKGLLILTTPNNPFNESPMSVEHFVEYSVEEVEKMLAEAGLKVIERKVMGVPLRWIMKQAKRMKVQTNRYDPSNEERGMMSKASDKLKFVRDFCNHIFPYKIAGINWGNLGLNMVLVAEKV